MHQTHSQNEIKTMGDKERKLRLIETNCSLNSLIFKYRLFWMKIKDRSRITVNLNCILICYINQSCALSYNLH